MPGLWLGFFFVKAVALKIGQLCIVSHSPQDSSNTRFMLEFYETFLTLAFIVNYEEDQQSV
ncbi:MAG TPA: hypothetical protein VK014_09560 [Cyclobacteriaceae bacterium]|nr:hypothetical protein [Cyclobacteriaceae bacterium]